jgi:hypothetical protein
MRSGRKNSCFSIPASPSVMHGDMLLWRYHQSLPTCGVSLADVQLEGLDGIAHAHTQRPAPA